MPPRANKTYTLACSECREITREIVNLDREDIMKKYIDILDEKFQTRQDIVEKLDNQGNLIKYLIISNIIQWLSVTGIIFYLINKAWKQTFL